MQAATVRKVFHTYNSGQGIKAVAAMLNRDKVPSPGSYWRGRKIRRASGWTGSSVRVMLHNALYTGQVQWNRTRFRKEPETETRVSRKRPEDEVLRRQEETLRIIDQATWAAAPKRISDRAKSFKTHSANTTRRKYLLSGLLVCDHCQSHFILADRYNYACSSSVGGGHCKNIARLNRKELEKRVMALLQEKLTSPAMLREYAAEVLRYYAETEAAAAAAIEPQKLKELDARIVRLQRRLKDGDPDIPPAQLEAAMNVAREEGRKALGVPAALKLDQNLLANLPTSIKALRRELRTVLDGNPKHIEEARLVLSRLMPERLRLRRNARGKIQVRYALQFLELPVAMVAGAGLSSGLPSRGYPVRVPGFRRRVRERYGQLATRRAS